MLFLVMNNKKSPTINICSWNVCMFIQLLIAFSQRRRCFKSCANVPKYLQIWKERESMKWSNIKGLPYCSRARMPAHCARLCRNPWLILSLLFPQLRWQTDTLLKVIRAVLRVPLEPRWWPGHIPKWDSLLWGQSGDKPTGVPRRRLHGDEAKRPPATQARTFLDSDSASPRSPPRLTAISCKLWSPPSPAPNPFTPSLFVVFFKAGARAKADNSPPLFVLAVLLFWGLLGTVVRCEIRPSSPGRTCEGMYRRGTAHSAQTLLWFFYPRVWNLHSQKHSPFRSWRYRLQEK